MEDKRMKKVSKKIIWIIIGVVEMRGDIKRWERERRAAPLSEQRYENASSHRMPDIREYRQSCKKRNLNNIRNDRSVWSPYSYIPYIQEVEILNRIEDACLQSNSSGRQYAAQPVGYTFRHDDGNDKRQDAE